MYGRQVRGPLQIVQKLRTGDIYQEKVIMAYDDVTNLRVKIESTMKFAVDNFGKAPGTL